MLEALAQVSLKTPEDGGRAGPLLRVTHRCIAVVGGSNLDCQLEFREEPPISPGDYARVRLKFPEDSAARSIVKPGVTFELREARVIGTGRIVEVLPGPA